MAPVAETRIQAIEAFPIRLPVRREWMWRGLQQPLGRWVIVRVHTDDGRVGLGEAAALPDWGGDHGRYYGETQETVAHVVRDLLGPLLTGSDPWDVEPASQRMRTRVKGHRYAKAAIEMALHDLRGKMAGLPLYQLLGGAVRDGVQVAHMIGIMSADEAVDEVRGAFDEGIRAFQVKGTGDVARDVAIIERLRAAVGGGVTLRLDANQGYPEPKLAIDAVRRLADAGVDLVEQPTEGMRQMAEVRRSVGVRIIADESCWQPEDAAAVGVRRAADAISIYLAKAGGICQAGRVAAVADAFGLPCDVNGSLESAVGNAANVHFALATPAVTLASVIPISAPSGAGCTIAGRYYEDDLVADPFPFADGSVRPPPGPGLGIELDEERLNAFRTA
jgi:L-alanine-DL-glutamate epimerase-like enolase superfamily enzyme